MNQVTKYVSTMNKAEQLALKRLFDMSHKDGVTYRQFRKTAIYSHMSGNWFVPWAGMVVGIEDDGLAHS